MNDFLLRLLTPVLLLLLFSVPMIFEGRASQRRIL